MVYFLIFFIIFLWVGGYMMTARFMSTSGVQGEDLEKFITPPKYLYYLCGKPVHKRYPKGTMRVIAFRTQMTAIFMGLSLAWIFIIRPPTYVILVGFGIGILIPFPLTAYISKHYAAKNQTGIRWRSYSKNRVGTGKRKK